jgi:hypothetical protein
MNVGISMSLRSSIGRGAGRVRGAALPPAAGAGADLCGATLEGAAFGGASLAGAALREANLAGAAAEGGCSLRGGEVSVLGIVLGAATLQVLLLALLVAAPLHAQQLNPQMGWSWKKSEFAALGEGQTKLYLHYRLQSEKSAPAVLVGVAHEIGQRRLQQRRRPRWPGWATPRARAAGDRRTPWRCPSATGACCSLTAYLKPC